MTISQLDSLTENELDLLLYIVNEKSDIFPKIEFSGRDLCWIKHQALIEHIIKVDREIKEEFIPIYISMLSKLGVEVMKKEENTTPPNNPPTQNEPTQPVPAT